MTETTISVEGLYTADANLFVGLQVPEGMDKQTVINSILLECMELEVLYPRPATMKNMISIWSAKEINTWKRIYAAEQTEYNPIENYDRHQTDTRQETHSGDDVTAGTAESNTTGRTTGNTTDNTIGNTTGSNSGTGSVTSSGQNGTTTNATGNLTDNKLHKFAAFNSGDLLDQTKDEQTAQSTNTQTEQSANEQTEQSTNQQTSSENVSQSNQGTSEQNQTGTVTENKVTTLTHGEQVGETFTSYIHGNIGVTTSQQMLESELELAPKINTINYIVNSFKMRFCILVY